MEIIGDWHLVYRSEHDLIALARQAGFCLNDIRVGVEPAYVNLFLHLKQGAPSSSDGRPARIPDERRPGSRP